MLTLALLLVVGAAPARPVHTYSIIARDSETRELVKRLPAVDQLPKDPKQLEQILAIR